MIQLWIFTMNRKKPEVHISAYNEYNFSTTKTKTNFEQSFGNFSLEND